MRAIGRLAYTARAVTHIDAFRLDRADFIGVMRSHPAGAVHVADLMGSVLPTRLAKQVTREICAPSLASRTETFAACDGSAL